VIFQSLAAGDSASVKWVITCGSNCAGEIVTVTAQGIIQVYINNDVTTLSFKDVLRGKKHLINKQQGWLPYTYKTSTVNYPPYYYIDAIGETLTFSL